MADHARFLAEAMQHEGAQVGFIHRGSSAAASPLSDAPVSHWDGRSRSLKRCVLQQQPDWLWIQLSGYGYSRWGAPFTLGRAVAALRRVLPSLGIVACVHETHCQPHQLGRKGWLLSPWQRYTVATVVRQAHLLFTSIGGHVEQMVRDYGVSRDRVVRLPIGSNVPPAHLTAAGRRRIRGDQSWGSREVIAVTFGSYPSQLRALQLCGLHLERGLAMRRLDRVVCLGGDESEVPRAFEYWARVLGSVGAFEVLGYQSAKAVGEILECCDFAFSRFPRRLLGKSGSFAAYAQAGLVVLAADDDTAVAPSGEELPVLSIRSWDWRETGSPAVLAFGQRVREHARIHLAWPVIARRALAEMQASRPQEQSRAEMNFVGPTMPAEFGRR
jgi:hypothetical protein